MSEHKEFLLSVVVPVYNESAGLLEFHKSLLKQIEKVAKNGYEIIYCDDGSSDETAKIVRELHKDNPKIKLIRLSRNFGKESALSAGIHAATGDAILMIDGDGQYPVELIPDFIAKWQTGSDVVVGIRSSNKGEGWFKKIGSHYFYKLFNRLTGEKLIPRSTDFRLIDRNVQEAFITLGETDRMTRVLIDWLGFSRSFIDFEANARSSGPAGYNRRKLVKLATHSFVSMTPVPLFLFGYLGVFITAGALLLGGSVLIEQILLDDPWHWKFTGTAMIGILLLFLVGIVLMAQGMLSLYISHIHSQAKQRPLYVIDYENSAGIRKV
ncbi:glycosyltransferase family 2 protein [Candidatus Saccharibacteria bacterium]|nr:glycosyltransferase family 2 protein [Candidatus Saccharibacteria bacterium]